MDPYAVVKKPVYTEKCHQYIEASNTYTFDVDENASKYDIRDAVENLWNIKVSSVRVMNVRGKPKNYRYARHGLTRMWKKAFVRLAEGQAIDELK
ncbi:MAG: 50S ribosomal protein L23 [Planctomycetes bacterium]|nr:50S ribosomal protein L23 [Planctomycetota bacterium]